jgi:hypothetical protein
MAGMSAGVAVRTRKQCEVSKGATSAYANLQHVPSRRTKLKAESQQLRADLLRADLY